VLHHDRHIAADHRRVVGVARDGLGVVQVIEPLVDGAAARGR
jgi:hypothetical protein